MTRTLDERLAIGTEVVRRAGRMVHAAYRDPALGIAGKGPGDLVSDADLAVERMAAGIIGEAFPDDGFLGEEFGGVASRPHSWLIDPIDGTVNFCRKISYFCVSLTLLAETRPIASWILDPEREELFHADPSGRATLNGNPIRVSSVSAPAEAVVGLGFSRRHPPELAATIVDRLARGGMEHRRLGAGALTLAHVAAGRIDAYIEPHMNPWDATGGLLLARSAGAVTIDYVAAGGIRGGAPVYAAAPGVSVALSELLPPPFVGIPLQHDERGDAVSSPRSSAPLTQHRGE